MDQYQNPILPHTFVFEITSRALGGRVQLFPNIEAEAELRPGPEEERRDQPQFIRNSSSDNSREEEEEEEEKSLSNEDPFTLSCVVVSLGFTVLGETCRGCCSDGLFRGETEEIFYRSRHVEISLVQRCRIVQSVSEASC